MLIGYLGVKLTLPMRSRSVDVLRPVVELINFNLNVIKICGFPAFCMFKKNSPEECCGSTFKSNWACCGVLWGFIFEELISWVTVLC